jgi:predicted transcriptional regulator
LHRSKVDIIADILEAAVGGTKKTHIMYGCNLSFEQLRTYLNLLLDRGLLRTNVENGQSGDPTFFQTTTKGHTFLKAHRNLRAILTT